MKRPNWEAIGAIAGTVALIIAFIAWQRTVTAPVPMTLPTVVPVTVIVQPTVVPTSTDTPSSVERSEATDVSSSTPPAVSVASAAMIFTGDIMTVTSPIEMELVRVSAGKFWMGSDPAKDSQASDYEQPQHRVDLPEYYIGKYEVTNAQYQAFVRATAYETPFLWENGRIPAGKEEHPVVNVSWNDAIAFTDWLSATTGLAFRLPTEAEWEKSCRGTEGLIYPWGDSAPDSGKANFINNVGDTTSVGSYAPKGDSPYGVADMAGNVWEWTGSLWGPSGQEDYGYPYDPKDGREDLEAPNYVWRVVRGGSFFDYDGSVRCAHRNYAFPHSSIGFRVVCVSPPS